MLNTYLISINLREDAQGPFGSKEGRELSATVVVLDNHEEEAGQQAREFFEDHGLHTTVVNVWEVA